MINIGLNKSLRFAVDVDYLLDCSDCNCYPDYCRCGVINNPTVKQICPYMARDLVRSHVTGDDTEKLLAFMFFRHCLDGDDFYVSVCNGYYGQEIDDVKLENYGPIDRFNRFVEEGDTRALLAMVLADHYGYVLPDVMDYKEWELISVPVSKIVAPKPGMQQVFDVGYDTWDDRAYPSYYPGCVVVPCCDDKLKIIDGFHRWTNFTSKKKRRKVKVLAPIIDKNNT